MLLTAPLVARLHNNLLVVEVWQRSQTPGQDRLVGLSRLPLERLYLTFSQPDVTDTVLQMKVRMTELVPEQTVPPKVTDIYFLCTRHSGETTIYTPSECMLCIACTFRRVCQNLLRCHDSRTPLCRLERHETPAQCGSPLK